MTSLPPSPIYSIPRIGAREIFAFEFPILAFLSLVLVRGAILVLFLGKKGISYDVNGDVTCGICTYV